MVNHHVESACGVLSQKAIPWASTDHMQGVDAFSTPKIAPTTPMQAWQKPLHRQESPADTLPSLSLGRSSTELKAAYLNSNVSQSLPMSPKCGLASASTPTKLHGRIEMEVKKEGSQLHKENLLSFSLSKYEKNYDMATPLRNHMGPSSSHRVCAPAGDFKILPNGSSESSQEGLTMTNVGVVDESPSQGPMLCKKSELTNIDAEAVCKANDRVSLYSPVPGEIANDAFKLYSELFPSTSTATAVCMSSSMDVDAHSNVFLGKMDSMQLRPPDFGGHKPLAWERCVQKDDRLEGGKKCKLTTMEEGATSKRLLVAKQEPVFEESYGTQVLSSCGNACPGDAINPTWKDCSGLGNARMSMDFSFLKSSHVQPEMLPTSQSSPISSKVDYDHIAKPAVGLKLFTSSKNAQVPTRSSTPFAGEPSRLLACNAGAWETPLQGNPSSVADWGKFLALSATPSGHTDKTIMLPFQERFKSLQTFLKQCDEAGQNEGLQGLRSLSAEARSGYAVELETRAIHLSLEEGKELQRMRLLNVLGRVSESSLEELGATPHGQTVLVPGDTSPLAHAP